MEKYLDPKEPGSFSGLHKFYKSLNGQIKRKKVEDFLKQQDAYTLHKYKRIHFKRNKVIVGGMMQQWDSDVGFLDDFAQQNDNYKYFVVFIDVFSQYLYTHPLKTKEAKEMVQAIKFVFSQGHKPLEIRTDKGGEYMGVVFKRYLKSENVEHIITENETKAAFAERVIKTIKKRLYRYFTYSNNNRWIDVLQDITTSYNSTFHRSIGMAPSDVNTENAAKLWLKLCHQPKVLKFPKLRFDTGDSVRISYLEGKFHRDFDQHFTREVFTVSKRKVKAGIPVYQLTDYNGEVIDGWFYGNEMQHVIFDPNADFKIEKILKTRKRKGKTDHLVKWLGCPDKFNSWVSDQDVKNI